MVRYLTLLHEGMKISLMKYMTYRVNFILMIIQNIVHITLTIASMEFLFNYINEINGWTKAEMIVLLSTTQIINALYRGGIRPNHLGFTSSIGNGTFDFLMLKPINPMYSMNFGYFDLSSLLSGFLPLIIIFSYYPIGETLSFSTLILYFLLIVVSTLIIGLIMFIMYCVAFIVIRIERYEEVYYTIMSFIEKPKSVYEGVLSSTTLLFLLPILAISSVPAEILLNKSAQSTAIGHLAIFIMFFLVGKFVLNSLIKKYQSANG